MRNFGRPICVTARRNGCIDAEHRIDVAVMQGGHLVAACGNPGKTTLFRSAAKPLLGVELALREPTLDTDELAIACASHNGSGAAIQAAERLLARAGATTDDLRCSCDPDARIAHPCSGSHAGLALLGRLIGAPLEGYNDEDHPVQQCWRARIGDATGTDWKTLRLAGDGCCLPTVDVTLEEAARAFAWLASDGEGCIAVRRAMTEHTDLVGDQGSPDVVVMTQVDGAVAKWAAGGLLCIGLPGGIGITLKCADSSATPLIPAVFAVLGVETSRPVPIFDSCGKEVGELDAEPIDVDIRGEVLGYDTN